MNYDFEKVTKTWEENIKKMNEKDANAKNQNILLGRFLRESAADGYAFYEIIRVNKKTVRVRVIKNIGDDYRVPQWGNEATVPLNYAINNIQFRDRISDLFNKKNK
jgi:hypothetical protein